MAEKSKLDLKLIAMKYAAIYVGKNKWGNEIAMFTALTNKFYEFLSTDSVSVIPQLKSTDIEWGE